MTLKEELETLSTVEVYELVLDRHIYRFPEGFWQGEDGKARGLECLEYLLFQKLEWKEEDVPKKFSKKTLKDNKLNGMLAQCFRNSPLECILTLMRDKFKPWEYNVAPTNYWTKENALFSMECMIESLNWDEEDIKKNLCLQTFKDFGLNSMIMKFYNSSPYQAISDLYPGKFKEWEFNNVPLNFWTDNKCKEAVLWVLENELDGSWEDKSFKEIRDAFMKNRLSYILQHKFKNNVNKLIQFAENTE